ncbi:MAG: ABC transporter permease, partial [Lachnospiraceae bacterium]|nr:ABC transporter permease [Lachnospiraceae bacterium]
YMAGFKALNEEIPMKEFMTFMGMNLLMNIEVAAICFGISSMNGKNKMGLGLGIALIFYVYDLIGRVVPDLKDSLFVGPYSYANASSIFSGKETDAMAVTCAVIITVIALASAFVIYDRRDLAS